MQYLNIAVSCNVTHQGIAMSQPHMRTSLDYMSKGCTPVEVLPVPNAYITF